MHVYTLTNGNIFENIYDGKLILKADDLITLIIVPLFQRVLKLLSYNFYRHFILNGPFTAINYYCFGLLTIYSFEIRRKQQCYWVYSIMKSKLRITDVIYYLVVQKHIPASNSNTLFHLTTILIL